MAACRCLRPRALRILALVAGVLPLLGGREARLLDLPRFGRRFKPDGVTAWLAAEVEGEAPVVLVGHSMGGLVCASLAAERPELVRALVLIAPAGAPELRSLQAYATRARAHRPRGAARARAAHSSEDAIRTGPEALLHGALFATGARLRRRGDGSDTPRSGAAATA